MKQRQLFDQNPNLFTFSKTAIEETTGKLIPISSSSSQYPGQQQYRFNQTLNSGIDLYKNMKPLVLLGQIILIIPCSKSNYSTYKQLKLSLSMLPLFVSILISIWTFVQVIVNFKFVVQMGGKGQLGAMGYVAYSHFFMNSLFQFLMYVYFIMKSDKFYRIFYKWSEITARINLEEDKFLKYLAYALVASLAAPLAVHFAFMADIFNNGSPSSSDSGSTFISTLERVFQTVLAKWADFVPYNPCFVIFHLVFDVWTTLSRFFVPPLIIFFSRATSFQFRKLIENATTKEMSEAHNADMRNKGKAFWHELVKKHRELVHLVRTMSNFLSPIIFSWVVLNIYNVSMLLYRVMVGNISAVTFSTYLFTLGFTVEVVTFVITIISVALVNKNAEKILVVLRNCPKEDFYDTEVCRLEHQIATGPHIGFGGLGCFVITKPFLLKVFNAVFTMEIIMLQAIPNSNKIVDRSIPYD